MTLKVWKILIPQTILRNMPKTIHIHYYAVLREQRGVKEEAVETSANTAIQLYSELQKKYNLRLPTNILKVAINEEFSGWNTEIRTGDTVVFIPPVAGG